MKPNFALSLSFEGIRLLHRSVGGWRTVGDVALDAADMSGELAILRKTAAALEPGGVRTKVLIPKDQIKFMTIDTPGLSDAERMQKAHIALEGATPYEVDDLAYDISIDGAKTHIAAVARETLAEAEAFATEHRFYPVSFVAQPEDAQFRGEPFFGPTEAAASLLERDQAIEPDDEAVVVLGPYVAPSAPEDAEPEEQADLLEEQEETASKPEPAPVDAKKAADVPEEAGKNAENSEAPATKPDPVPAPKLKEPASAQAPVSQSLIAPAQSDKKQPVPPTVVSPPKTPVAVQPTVRTDAPAPSTGFASRRSAPLPAVGSASRTLSAAAPSVTKPKPAEPAAAPVPDSRSLSAVPVAAAKSTKLGFLSRRKPRKAPQPPAPVPLSTTLAMPEAGLRLPKVTSEAEQMTIFGARRSDNVGGKPRFLGLLLTAALLIFLAGVAAWASVFMDDGISLSRLFGTRDTTAVASLPAQTDPAENADATATVPPEIPMPQTDTAPETPDARLAALDPNLTDEDGAVLDALRVPELLQPRVLTQQEVEAKYATTGIWVLGPETPNMPSAVPVDDLYMTSIDPVSTANDAVALPTVASFGGDTFNFIPSSPAAAGTTFSLDNNGLVIPTPDGAVNPDGVLVIAGRPPVEPPQTLSRTTQAPALSDQGQPGLLDFRPVLRPDDLVESNERSSLDGLTRVELAALRPALRPASIQQLAAAAAAPAPDVDAATAAAGASLAALQATPPKPAGPVLNNATPFAVQASLRPDTRPSNFARIVSRAEQARPEPEPAPTQVASSASVAPRSVAPTLPSKTSVAKQATVKNAIKMRDINLIGVYGKPSSRRALIRLSNGRYQKVAVGDRLDGGRVSAIGDGELRYNRRGRDVVLKMPRG
jgi:hypothetical protein